MAIDGGLRQLFQKHIPEAHWQAIETGSTGRGIPDLNYCLKGVEGWIELKKAKGWRAEMRPEQIAWIERRARNGGRVMIAVRRIAPKEDQLWLFPARAARDFATNRLDEVYRLGLWTADGPSGWNWEEVKIFMARNRF